MIAWAALKPDRDALTAATKAKTDFEATVPRVLMTQSGPPRTVRILPRGNWLDESGPVIPIPKRPGEPDITFADTTKIRARLDWAPKVSFEEGVRRILDIIDYWRGAPLWNSDSIADATKTWFSMLAKDR